MPLLSSFMCCSLPLWSLLSHFVMNTILGWSSCAGILFSNMNITCNLPMFAKERVVQESDDRASEKKMAFVLVIFARFMLIATIHWALTSECDYSAKSCMYKIIFNSWNNPTRFGTVTVFALQVRKLSIRHVKKFIQIHKTNKCQRQVSNSGLSKPVVLTAPLYWHESQCQLFCLFYTYYEEIYVFLVLKNGKGSCCCCFLAESPSCVWTDSSQCNTVITPWKQVKFAFVQCAFLP